MRGERAPRIAGPSPEAQSPAESARHEATPASIEPILAAVKTLLRGRGVVALPHRGIDLVFDCGVIAKCRTCHLSWEVSRRHFSSLAWWACPGGCPTPGTTLD